jgi:hypothetical protein
MTKRRKRSRSRSWTVGLVSMPFKDLRHPPIQLGILESCLARENITARSHSLELAFMEHLQARSGEGESGPLTIADYQQIAHQAFVVQLGDWIFKVPPYAEASAADDEAYFACIRGETTEQSIVNAKRMRELVPSFLEAAANELLAGEPRIIGFSSVFQQNVPSLVLAKILKEKDPSLIVVFGGDNCEGPMGPALHRCFPWIDVVVRGEGERVLVEVVKDVLAERPIRPQPGLCYRDPAGGCVAVPESEKPELPMDEVPTPIYDENFDRLANSPLQDELWSDVAILFESSRGCWWGQKSHCTFCGLNAATMMFRSKPAERVAREILQLAERHKVLSFVAVDDIIELAHIRDLMPILRDAGCDFSIFYETKANLTKDQIRAFFNAGRRHRNTAGDREPQHADPQIDAQGRYRPPEHSAAEVVRGDRRHAVLECAVRVSGRGSGRISAYGRSGPFAGSLRCAKVYSDSDPALQPLFRARRPVRHRNRRSDAVLPIPLPGRRAIAPRHRLRFRASLFRWARSRQLHATARGSDHAMARGCRCGV